MVARHRHLATPPRRAGRRHRLISACVARSANVLDPERANSARELDCNQATFPDGANEFARPEA
jgi:hypothetical protein